MRKIMVVLTVLVLLSGTLISCGESRSIEEQIEGLIEKQKKIEKKEAAERVKSQSKFFGKYLTDNPEEYLELKKDGTFDWKWKERYTGVGIKKKGEWEVKEEEIIFSQPWLPTGMEVVKRGRIKGDNIIDPDGKVWVRKNNSRKKSEKMEKIVRRDKKIEGISKIPRKKVTKSHIIGKYIMGEVVGVEKEPGIMNFKKDGTVTITVLGTWKTEGSRISFYEGDERIRSQQISDDTIGSRLIKKEGAKIVKVFEVEVPVSIRSAPKSKAPQAIRAVPPTSEQERAQEKAQNTELKKIILWSEYVSENGQYNLKLRENGTFSEEKSSRERWKIENGLIQVYEGNRKVAEGRAEEDNTIIFKTKDGRIKLVKQD